MDSREKNLLCRGESNKSTHAPKRSACRTYGVVTVRYPVVEVTATVEPFDNHLGCTLRVLRIGKPRTASRPLLRNPTTLMPSAS